MADTLNVYKGEEIVGSAERGEDGKAKVTVDGLDANTDYPTGTYQVSFSNENGESEKVDVPSFKTKPIAVTGVTLDKTTLSLQEGATGNLVATVAPSTATDKTVTFASSDAAIATVDNTGKVTAVKPGAADITVTTKDGSKTAKCELTVTAKQIPVTGVTLDKSTLSLEEGATATLIATIEPSNASYKAVSFTSSDDAIATVDNDGLVTAVAAGSADITVESIADGSKTAKCTLTVTDTEGNAKYDTFITPTQIPFRKIYDAANLMDNSSDVEKSAQENIDEMLDMVVDIYNNQFTKDSLLDRLNAPDAVEELQQQIEFIAQGEMDEERKKQLAKMI